MSFQIMNVSQNPLLLSDGKMLAPVGADGSRRVLDTIDKTDKDFEKRGWITIFEEQPKEIESSAAQSSQPIAKLDVKTEGVKK